MEYGLVGAVLAHSYSKQIHAMLGDYPYELTELDAAAFDAFMAGRSFKGINVTIPYKQRVMAFCDEIDADAQAIGAVNTVVNRGGRLTGYNTDILGVKAMVEKLGIPVQGKAVLLLGNGASAKTAAAAIQQLGAGKILVASRTPTGGAVSYEKAQRKKETGIIVNCSPAGMYPHNGESLLDPGGFPNLSAVFDLVYNPFRTKLLLRAQALDIPCENGLAMLVAQAKAAAEIFLKKPIAEEKTGQIRQALVRRLANVSLVGMPGSGKTSLGKELAKRLGKKFVDLDAMVEEKACKTIPEIFAEDGEAVFRKLESEAAAVAGKENGQVLSTGGGIVLRKENIDTLRQNGPVIFIDCPVKKLSISNGRPLSKTRGDLEDLYGKRLDLYKNAADESILFCDGVSDNVTLLKKAFESAVARL